EAWQRCLKTRAYYRRGWLMVTTQHALRANSTAHGVHTHTHTHKHTITQNTLLTKNLLRAHTHTHTHAHHYTKYTFDKKSAQSTYTHTHTHTHTHFCKIHTFLNSSLIYEH